jgi:hypothetical protein
MLIMFQVNSSVFGLPNPCLKAANSDFQISGQIWYFTILLCFLSNPEVDLVENTHKMQFPFSPLISTCHLVNSSNIAHTIQPQTWFHSNSDFWSIWPLAAISYFRWRVTFKLVNCSIKPSTTSYWFSIQVQAQEGIRNTSTSFSLSYPLYVDGKWVTK